MNVLIITAPGVQSVLADTLPDLLPAYIADCVANGIADSTRVLYQRQIVPFMDWLERGAPSHDWLISADLLRQYPVHLSRERGLRPATVETYCRRMRQMFKWLYKSGRLTVDISQWIPKQPPPPPRTNTLTPPQLGALFAAVGDAYRVRNLTLLAFLTETGARRIEAAHVRWQDVSFAEKWRGVAYLPRVKGYLLTDRTRTVVFGDVTGKLLQMHHVLQTESGVDERVFRISNTGVRDVLLSLSNATGVAFSAHDLRRTFATYWIKHCQAPNPSLAEQLLELQLGHSSRSITRRHYLALTIDDVLAHYVSPLAAVDLGPLNVS